jgi:hypothetical protein
LALPPINMSDETFVREVDEALQQDQLLSFWKRYGKLLVAAVIGGLLAFGGYLYWQDRQVAASGVEGETYEKAIRQITDKNVGAADKELDALKASDNQGYRASALLTKAIIALDKGDLKAAAALYGQVATDTNIPKPWRDLALVRQSTVEFDTAKPDLIIARLKPLVVKGEAFHGGAGELVAISYLKIGKPDMAKPIFEGIAKDETVPETIRSRAVQISGILGSDVVDATSEVKKQ